MRALATGLVGAAAAVIAFGVSQVAGGFVAAMAFVLALFLVPVTIGLVIAAVVSARDATATGLRPSVMARMRRLTPGAGPSQRCSTCGRKREPGGSAWVCRTCDTAVRG